MKVINYPCNKTIKLPKVLSAFKDKRICIFDIETTGLNRHNDKVILIGYFSIINGKETEIKQIFAEHPNEEKTLLNYFVNEVLNFDIFITFNGQSFDIPFLQTRLNHHNIEFNLFRLDHIDLFRYVKAYKYHLNLDNLKLKTIEKFLGIIRDDTITGKESVALYTYFVNTQCKKSLEKILLHNFEDILHLGGVLEILNYLPLHEQEFATIRHKISCHNTSVLFTYKLRDIKIVENKLFITGTTNTSSRQDIIYHDFMYQFKWSPQKGNFDIEYIVNRHDLTSEKFFYAIDLKDFRFIDSLDSNKIINDNLILATSQEYNFDLLSLLINSTINHVCGNISA
ncbi:ribonuclease H-like domain-containing protein [Serpentinicella sp. ANB-PHB4]|uniref:ribonuclease H-like domain-containing protein n=1 Tax=Serpentinicella sp. ANB-PHB4 TaxID=3074076 RepID=UPI0028640A5B|nr:ribonuclease H-like domain-containing protein [Serpentinicella sp. ANB-PHB4]MDR5660048.1 ribonuclease H-like domain-containing protein [Serpentinicella sp. ANB-PHB4]